MLLMWEYEKLGEYFRVYVVEGDAKIEVVYKCIRHYYIYSVIILELEFKNCNELLESERRFLVLIYVLFN